MNRSIPCVVSLLVVFAGPAGCGDDEPPPPEPRQRCAEQNLKAHASGAIDTDGDSASIDIVTDDETPGRITDRQIRIRLGEATPPGETDSGPLLLRLHDPTAPDDFARALDDLTRHESLRLEVEPVEIPAGSEDLTSMNDSDCGIQYDSGADNCSSDGDCADGYQCHEDQEVCSPDPDATQGSICAQIGFDANGDNNLHSDNEEYVYNATGGEVTIEGFDTGPPPRFAADWSLELGPNILSHDDPSTGELDGCIWPGYATQSQYWPLE